MRIRYFRRSKQRAERNAAPRSKFHHQSRSSRHSLAKHEAQMVANVAVCSRRVAECGSKSGVWRAVVPALLWEAADETADFTPDIAHEMQPVCVRVRETARYIDR